MPVVAYVDLVRMNSLNSMACIQSHLLITTRSTTCHIYLMYWLHTHQLLVMVSQLPPGWSSRATLHHPTGTSIIISQAAEKKHTVKIHYNKHQVRHVCTRINYQRSATTYNQSLHATSVVKDNYRLFCLSKCSSFLALLAITNSIYN